MCGEKQPPCPAQAPPQGSPPRVRGKVIVKRFGALFSGITPACAGKSKRGNQLRQRDRDHPRVCGEKLFQSPLFRLPLGSPPRVRGKVVGAVILDAEKGITPACAGKSFSSVKRLQSQRDHPRVCGEKTFNVQIPTGSQGSPPRVRGKAHGQRDLVLRRGITPACAGKSRSDSKEPGMEEDHPRVCGEKRSAPRQGVPRVGSPPRVRGKVREQRGPHLEAGITPACAGKRSHCSATRVNTKDHPRVCGEKVPV